MSTIGQQLLQPESGWKRYDDTNINFEYKGLSLNSRNYGYNSDVHFGNTSDVYVRFNYKSKKGLRVISPTAWDATAVKVMVDGVLNGSFNQYSSSIVSSVFVYELKGDGKEHSVEISKQNVNSSYLYWDTIDVDKNGILKPYNPNLINNYYLLKQNSNYYSINNNYIGLGEIDGDKKLNNLIDKYGYDDLSIITQELNNKKIPTKLENDYYKSFDINLNDIKDTINLIEENDKKYIQHGCSNYKISDEIKKFNNGKFEVLMKE
ncbi:hypothetical protein EXN57_07220 [Clostridium botulinum]|nr:hypothetical protein [Clostridium botulinum]NFD34590.1 hypothetical protein [Clostridium botulinum]NFD60149.1 hypothetical protein [Clostridium botulinum]NFE01114.1 hypothetical protein [Clostridium botulinum]